MAEIYDQLTLLSDLIDDAIKEGADAADAVVFDASSVSVSCRMGELEKLERSENNDLGLRVFVGKQQAIVSSTDFEPSTLREVVSRTVAMAKAAPEDPYCGLANAEQLVTDPPVLEICDSEEPSNETLIDSARTAEDAARAVTGVTNSEGAETGWSRARIAIATSNGFAESEDWSTKGKISFSQCCRQRSQTQGSGSKSLSAPGSRWLGGRRSRVDRGGWSSSHSGASQPSKGSSQSASGSSSSEGRS